MQCWDSWCQKTLVSLRKSGSVVGMELDHAEAVREGEGGAGGGSEGGGRNLSWTTTHKLPVVSWCSRACSVTHLSGHVPYSGWEASFIQSDLSGTSTSCAPYWATGCICHIPINSICCVFFLAKMKNHFWCSTNLQTVVSVKLCKSKVKGQKLQTWFHHVNVKQVWCGSL